MGLLKPLALVLGALILLPWDWQMVPGPMMRNTTLTPADSPQETAAFRRRVLTFPCSGEKCHAWLYLPTESSSGEGGGKKPPVVVAAHGLGCQKDLGLATYGERFARAGFAALIFDYRSFGGSTGEPRHWVSPARHLKDYESAVAFVKSELADTVDVTRINLWGTSLSGGHVLQLAGTTLRDEVNSVIAQVPATDGRAHMVRELKRRPLTVLRGMLAGLHDTLRRLAAYPPAYYQLVGEPGSVSFMDVGAKESAAFFRLHPKQRQGGWRNIGRCSMILEAPTYRPIQHVPAIKVPVLYLAASQDTLVPLQEIQAAVKATPDARLASMACGHFEVYSGAPLPFMVQHMLAFLRSTNGLPAMPMSVAEARTGEDHHTPRARAAAEAAAAVGARRDAAATAAGTSAEL